jgi:hypothetical protein
MDRRTIVVHVNDPCGFDVYIGPAVPLRRLESSVFANPYIIGRDGDRAAVIALYREYIRQCPELIERAKALRGKRLGCWCAPTACHGDILAAIADGRKWLTESSP